MNYLDRNYPRGMIPKAIAEAKKVQPANLVKLDWERAIYKDLENPDPKFSWRNWLSGLVP